MEIQLQNPKKKEEKKNINTCVHTIQPNITPLPDYHHHASASMLLVFPTAHLVSQPDCSDQIYGD